MEKSNPVLSVLMTCYNREQFIAQAIESVLASNYTDFELIVADDCSVDATVSIVEKYCIHDARVKLYINKSNLGQFENRNKAASFARGEYIKYVDSDDIIYPYTLQLMLNAMLRFPEAAMGFSYETGTAKSPFPFLVESSAAYQQHYFKGGLLCVGPIGLIIKKKYFDLVGGFEQYGMPSDTHFSLKIAAQYPVVAFQRDLFWWRLHGNQAFAESGSLKSVFDNFYYNNNVLKSEHCPLDAETCSKAVRNNYKILLRNIIKLVLANPSNIFKIKAYIK